MLYGSLATPKVADYFSKRTANAAAVDFGDHAPGNNAHEFENVGGVNLIPLIVPGSVLVTGKSQEFSYYNITTGTGTANLSRLLSPSTDDQETLALLTQVTFPSQNERPAGGIALKSNSSPNQTWITAGVGRGGSSAQYRSFRWTGGSSTTSWAHNSTNDYVLGDPYWVRLRIRPTRQLSRKTWAFGAGEPGSFLTDTIAANAWPSVDGFVGLAVGTTASPPAKTLFHYLSVGYNGAAAPFPWEIPA